MLTVDAVVFRSTPKRLEVLVIERGNPPFQGLPALPGGFVEMDEDLDAAVRRELTEETGLSRVRLRQFQTFGTPGRDPRGRTVSVAYLGTATRGTDRVQGGDDAARAFWISARRPGPLAFDHNDILRIALRELNR